MPAISVPANLAFDNYDDLKVAIADWLDRSDMTGGIPQMIALAEARMRRELVPYLLETRTTIAVVDGIGALPTDFGTLTRIDYDGTALPAYSAHMGLSVVDGSFPYAYSIEVGQLRLWPAGDWTVTAVYQPTIPQLSDAVASNVIIEQHPDAYFYGAMLFAEGYVANDQRASTFKALWDECIAEMKVYLTRQKYAGPLVPRAAFVP